MKHTTSILTLALAGLMLFSCGGSGSKKATSDDAMNAAAVMYNCFVLGNRDLPQACEDFVKEYEVLSDDLKKEVDEFLDELTEDKPSFADFLNVKGIRSSGETIEQMGYRYYQELSKAVQAYQLDNQDVWQSRIRSIQKKMDDEQKEAFKRGIAAFKADNPGAKLPLGM